MIYIKRFCFVIVNFITLLCIGIIVLLQLTTFPIFGTLYYTFTGNDPLTEDYMNWSIEYSEKFLNWYKDKFGPK